MRMHASAKGMVAVLGAAVLTASAIAAHGAPRHAAKLRYDGLYRTPTQVSGTLQFRRYIRFYPNGEAIAFGSTGSLDAIVSRINAGLAALVFPHAKVTIKGKRIAIRDANCSYTGKLEGKRLRLMRTCSNEPKPGLDEYRFVKAKLTPRDAPAKAPAGGIGGGGGAMPLPAR